jgi:hypothetical protein
MPQKQKIEFKLNNHGKYKNDDYRDKPSMGQQAIFRAEDFYVNTCIKGTYGGPFWAGL